MYRMNVATTLDDKYTKYTYVMLYSLFVNNEGAEIYVYLLQNSLTEESVSRLKDLCEQYHNHLVLLEVPEGEMDSRFLQTDSWPMEACYRLKLFDLLPNDVDRLLYLDADIIVNQNLDELYRIDLGDKKLAACRDVKMRDASLLERVNALRDSKICDLIEKDEYFNSGVLLLDVKRLRMDYSYHRYLEEASKIDFKIYAPDQDLLNLLHHQDVLWVDENKYDFYPAVQIEEGQGYNYARKNVSILHYTGRKPWAGGDHLHFNTERIWWEYALQTTYKEDFLESYVMDSLVDETIRDYVREVLHENHMLRQDVKATKEAVQNLLSKFN